MRRVERLDGIGRTLETHTEILNEHTGILNERTKTPNEHTGILSDQTSALNELIQWADDAQVMVKIPFAQTSQAK